ncbi:MAG: CoA synthetase [Geminicoccaceae bacterium]|nr:CoA synthetase [Geminicoccaceae bacterium]
MDEPALCAAEALAARIPDGASIVLAPDYSGCALAVVQALLRRPARHLRLIGCPQLGLQGDLLVGAGCVDRVETAAFALGEFGLAPAFDRFYRENRIEVVESTCPAIHAGLQAAEKGLPFMPLAGVLGSGLVALRTDWKVIDDPFGAGPILLVPAIRPDVALFHAPLADTRGNVWIGVRRELMVMAHAAKRTLVSVEETVDGDLLREERAAAGTIPALYVEEVAHVPGGARPNGLFTCYSPNFETIARYASAARTEAGFASFLGEWLDR